MTRHDGLATQDLTFSRVAWRLVPILMMCYIVSYLDRVNISFAKLEMLNDLTMSETSYGIGAGIFFFGYVLFGVPANMALHRIGARRWLAFILVMWGGLSSLMAFVTTPAQFYAVRLLLGAAEAGFLPGVILYLTYWFPSARRARIVALFQTAIPASAVLGGPLSGWILDNLNGQLGYKSWQWLFVIEAAPAVILGAIVWFYLDDGIGNAKWLSNAEKDLIRGTLTEENSTKESASIAATFFDFRILRLSLLALGLVIGVYAVSFWTPTLLREAGALSNTQIGWLSAIPSLVTIPAMYLLARSSDARRERRWHVAICAFIGALGLTMCAVFPSDIPVVVVALSIASIGLLSAVPLQWSLSTSFVGGASGAVAIGLINSVANIGGLLSPPLIGWLKDATGSVQLGLGLTAVTAVVAALLALSMPSHLVNK